MIKKRFKEFIGTGTLTIFDIDETLFHTKAKVAVVKDGRVVRMLDNQEFNTYKRKPGEEYEIEGQLSLGDSTTYSNYELGFSNELAKTYPTERPRYC